MNNPFSRLKHYLPDKNDPQENHATECLAACLVFSEKIRAAFLRFLFDNSTEIPLNALSAIQVVTQHPIEGGYLDLLLLQESKFVVAVEVKVKSPENCDHHRIQLQNYRKWMDGQKNEQGYLFTLVRNPETSFCPGDFGATGRHSWGALCKRFQEMSRTDNLSDVEICLINNLSDYLESEGIVSTY